MAFVHGLLLGLGLALLPGPVFFALLHKSITRGFRYGMAMAMGVVLSDATVIFITYIGFSQLFNESPRFQYWLGVFGACFTFIYGLYLIFSHRITPYKPEKEETLPRKRTSFVKGFLLNLLNPFMFLYWIGVLGVVSESYGANKWSILTFFLGTLVTIFTTDLAKSYGAKLLQRFIHGERIFMLNKISGTIMIVFALKLCYEIIYNHKII